MKMGSCLDFFTNFSDFPYFTRQALLSQARKFDILDATLNTSVARLLQRGKLIVLKRGFYVMREFFDNHKSQQSYLFFLANNLLYPSYISLESALQYHGLLVEAVNIVTMSVTLKLPREFKSRAGVFQYKKIAHPLFTDFVTKNADFDFTIAEPYKAIFDYLYYRTNRFRRGFYPDILEDLRIDINDIDSIQKEKLFVLIKKYTDEELSL